MNDHASKASDSSFTRFVLFVAAVLFALAAVSKLATALGGAKLTAQVDPVLLLSTRFVLVFGAVLELAVVALVCFSKNSWLRVYSVAGMSTLLASYRFLLWIFGSQVACDCLGVVTRYVPVSPLAADRGVQTALGLVILSSYGILTTRWVRGRNFNALERVAEKPRL